MVARKVAAALAVGCTSVIKVPAETPFSVLAFVEVSGVKHRSGATTDTRSLPAVPVFPPASSRSSPPTSTSSASARSSAPTPSSRRCPSLVSYFLRDLLNSHAGSTRIGKLLMQHASGTLKHLSMELGGNAPLIIFEDADIDLAVKGTLVAKFRCSGQTCVCANRIYVQ